MPSPSNELLSEIPAKSVLFIQATLPILSVTKTLLFPPLAIFAVVTLASAIFAVVTALLAILAVTIPKSLTLYGFVVVPSPIIVARSATPAKSVLFNQMTPPVPSVTNTLLFPPLLILEVLMDPF